MLFKFSIYVDYHFNGKLKRTDQSKVPEFLNLQFLFRLENFTYAQIITTVVTKKVYCFKHLSLFSLVPRAHVRSFPLTLTFQ